MKLLRFRWVVLVDLIWIALWSTLIYKFDGDYPSDYLVWFVIIAIVGVLSPWCFLSDGEICSDCNKLIYIEEPVVKHPFKNGDEPIRYRYYHRSCYGKLYPEKLNKES